MKDIVQFFRALIIEYCHHHNWQYPDLCFHRLCCLCVCRIEAEDWSMWNTRNNLTKLTICVNFSPLLSVFKVKTYKMQTLCLLYKHLVLLSVNPDSSNQTLWRNQFVKLLHGHLHQGIFHKQPKGVLYKKRCCIKNPEACNFI